jgi:hypothetical protein
VSGNGSVCNGTSDAYEVGQYLTVNGTAFPFSTRNTELSGRPVVTGPAVLAGLNVTRKIYVPPATGAGWARFLEVIENPTAAPITATIRIQTNAGSDGSTAIFSSSSGDTAFTVADRWLTTDDGDGSGDPSLNHNFWGAGAALPPTAATMTVFDCAGTQGPAVDFPMTVPARATRVIMHFAGQSANHATAQASARAIDVLPAGYLTGMTGAEINGVLNWRLCDSVDRDSDGQSCAAGDCNDAVASINTSAPELCDGLDNDCDGLTDEGFCRIGGTCYANGDADAANACQFCNAPVTASAATAWTLRTAGALCRASTGVCDVAESCTGASPACPADVLLPSSTVCRASLGGCDPVETCTGSSPACPGNVLAPSSTVCRASAGACDAAERCTGASNRCPTDVFLPATAVCRASTSIAACDPAETCSGVGAACPTDTVTRAPAVEVCDRVDNDCDGMTDDGFDVGAACSVGVGARGHYPRRRSHVATAPASAVAPTYARHPGRAGASFGGAGIGGAGIGGAGGASLGTMTGRCRTQSIASEKLRHEPTKRKCAASSHVHAAPDARPAQASHGARSECPAWASIGCGARSAAAQASARATEPARLIGNRGCSWSCSRGRRRRRRRSTARSAPWRTSWPCRRASCPRRARASCPSRRPRCSRGSSR